MSQAQDSTCNRPRIGKRIWNWILLRRKTARSIGMVAAANLIGSVLGMAGSLVQARFITPDDLGFVRKYSVVSGYVAFLSLGLFTILQRDYSLLMGQGNQDRARRIAAIVQSWCLLVSAVGSAALCIAAGWEVVAGQYKSAAAWLVQAVGLWALVYGYALSCIYRTGQEFERLAKGQLLSSLTTAAVLPLFWLWAFPALIVRSMVGQAVSSIYLHVFRPVKVHWLLPWREFLGLVKRGCRLYISDYLRYMFWPTVEVWLMLWIAGEVGVGLFVFSQVIVQASCQVALAVNQVYLPRLAQRFGEGASIRSCLALAVRPACLNLGISVCVILCLWLLLPPVVAAIFPKYAASVPLLRVLSLQLLIVSFSIPMYLITVLESYGTQLVAALAGLAMFVGATLCLRAQGFEGTSVAGGTLAGQVLFAAICLGRLLQKMEVRHDGVRSAGAKVTPLFTHSPKEGATEAGPWN